MFYYYITICDEFFFHILLYACTVKINRNTFTVALLGSLARKDCGPSPTFTIRSQCDFPKGVVLDAFDHAQKGKGVGWLKKQMCLIAYRGSYE